jgi:hypothetical protein
MDRPEPEPKPQYSILLQVLAFFKPFQKKKNPYLIDLPIIPEEKPIRQKEKSSINSNPPSPPHP